MRKNGLVLNYTFYGLTVIYLQLIVTTKSQWVIDDSGCSTPDGSTGTCIPVKQCQPILNYLLSVSPPTQKIKDTVASYYCGVVDSSPKVCCPYDGKIAGDSSTVENTSSASGISTKAPVILESHQKETTDSCKTPSNEIRTCIPVKQCQPILNFIQRAKPLTADDIATLRSYQCPDSDEVCCPDNSFIIPSSKDRQPPPDITYHKRLNLLPIECGPLLADRIIFGNKTALFEYPWMALLSYRITSSGSVDFRCGGSIINDWYILTAAHCIMDNPKLKLIGVRVGESNISTNPDCEEKLGSHYCATSVQDFGVAEIIPHPGFDRTTLQNDIGLIRLAQPINSTVESVKPVCLPTTEELRLKNFEKMSLTVTGWGITETGKRSTDLLQVNVPVVPEEECRAAYQNRSSAVIDHKQICAGGTTGGDSCGGDSGGPLQMFFYHNGDARFIQFGIVSFGPRFCGQDGYPGVYTNVIYYMDWILDNMKP